MRITIESVLDFLADENLGPVKIKNEDEENNWRIQINEPSVFGTNDKKFRCGISPRYFEDDDKHVVCFNSFKAVGKYGNDYKGDWFNFVKLVKNFSNWREAKDWFELTYGLTGSDLLSSSKYVMKVQKHEPNKDVKFPDHYKKLRTDLKSHKPYIDYLKKRKIPDEKIETSRLFVDAQQQRLIFPVYENNKLVFFNGRAIGYNPIRWIKSEVDDVYPIWNLDQVNGESIYLFEGIFDAMMVNNGVALFGTFLNPSMLEKIKQKNYSKIIVVLDNDKVGQTNKIKMAQALADEQLNVFIYNYQGIHETYKDFNEMKIANIPLELSKRVLPFDFKVQAQVKLGKIK